MGNEKGAPERDKWANQVESFLSVLGYIIGLGNIWRFPYMAFKNGGGAFLIPYSICAAVIGFPLFFLETALGQFMKRGAFEAWNIAPIMKGVGLGSFMIAVYCNIYYIVVMAWSILYFFVTISHGTLPWTTCDNWWNSDNCMAYDGQSIVGSLASNGTWNMTAMPSSGSLDFYGNMSTLTKPANETTPPTLAVVEFWDKYVLRKSSGLEDMGSLDNWPLLLSYLAAWVLCYFCTFKGVKSTGKVVYFTATFPYFVLLILLVKGCTLPGAVDGIRFYLEPNVTKLADPQVWVDAASQIVYSYGICFATLITFASFNDFNHDCFKHSVKLVTCCSVTSFINGFAVFTVVGNLAYVQNITVSSMTLSGPGLVFLVFPTALSLMPLPNLWNALFFFMIIILGIDSQFSGMEAVSTVVADKWAVFFSKKNRREIMVGLMCIIYIIIGIPFVMEGGIYIFELFNNYAVGGIALLWLAMMESIGIAIVYGADRFSDDIKLMIGYRVPVVFKICILCVTPLLTASILLFYIIKYVPPTFDGYYFSPVAQFGGWLLTLSTLLCVPGYAIYRVWVSDGSNIIEKIRTARKPRYKSHVEKYRREKEMKDEEDSREEMKVFIHDANVEDFPPVECIVNKRDKS